MLIQDNTVLEGKLPHFGGKTTLSPLVYMYTTSGQLNISTLSGGVRIRAKTANCGLVVEYMDRAQGPTVDFCTQTSRVTYTNTANLPTFHWWHRAAMSTQQVD